ncbi:hypothetical protein DFH27DRAFT_50513 [Peziza echinospora]|nr:hypothetical protein DFH27DRAFT_50513 [Peziza echinospora]
MKGPRHLGPVLQGVTFSLLGLSTIFVAMRFYCRHFIVRNVGSDDWIMLVALISVWGIGVVNNYQVKYGTGTHMADLPPFDPANMSAAIAGFISTLKVWYAYQLMYLVCLFWVKISVLAFYLRLSPNKKYHMSIYIVGGVVFVYTVIMVFVNAFECKTPSDAWATTWPKGCHDLVPIYYGQAGFNIFSDIVILILPIPTLLSLQVSKTKKVMLLLIFSVGSISVIASIVRINALYIWHHSMDKAYDGAWILLWSQVEVNAAIISSSAPALKPLLKGLVSGSEFFTSRYGRGTNGYSNGGSKVSKVSQGVALRSYGIDKSNHTHSGTSTHMTTEIRGKGTLNESEENIISDKMTAAEMNGGIYTTTDVTIDVEARKEKSRGRF